MRLARAAAACIASMVLMAGASAFAQTVAPPIQGATTTIPELTVAGTLSELAKPAGAPHVGEALALATELAIGTAPFGASSGGFLIKLDPSTGLQVRSATTFGPSFAERALTSGEGKVSVGVNFMSVTYDRLDDQEFNGLQILTAASPNPAQARAGVANIDITSKTTVISARMGVTDKLDIGTNIPIIQVKVNGTSTMRNGTGAITAFASGSALSNGLGDIAALAKYRFYSFGDGQPDPGGLAVMATMRLPTGSRDSLRGLGVTRTLVSLIASSGQRRFRPHANVGFGFWSKGVTITSDEAPNETVEARHQFEYAAGIELEAAPKLTLLVDLLGGAVLGGGKLGFVTTTGGGAGTGITSTDQLVALSEGVQRIQLAPGLKVNLKGKMLLSLNALVSLHDSGLHTRVTPVAGIDLTF
jgi:hypothetical protein